MAGVARKQGSLGKKKIAHIGSHLLHEFRQMSHSGPEYHNTAKCFVACRRGAFLRLQIRASVGRSAYKNAQREWLK